MPTASAAWHVFGGRGKCCSISLLGPHGRGNAAKIDFMIAPISPGGESLAIFFLMTDFFFPNPGASPSSAEACYFRGCLTHWGRSPLFLSPLFSFRIPPFPLYSHNPLRLRVGVTPPPPPPPPPPLRNDGATDGVFERRREKSRRRRRLRNSHPRKHSHRGPLNTPVTIAEEPRPSMKHLSSHESIDP